MMRRNLICAHRFAKMRFVVARRASGAAGDEQVSASTKRTPQQEWEAAAREDRLDFMTASKMLLSEPTRRQKFGLDFHIVQFVLACIPSLGESLNPDPRNEIRALAPYWMTHFRMLWHCFYHLTCFCLESTAVYLLALYARSEMRRMEKEKEVREVERNQKYPPATVEITDIKARLKAIEGVVEELRSEVTKPAITTSVEGKTETQVNAQQSGISTSQTAPPMQGPSVGEKHAEAGDSRYHTEYGEERPMLQKPASFVWNWSGRGSATALKADPKLTKTTQSPHQVPDGSGEPTVAR